MRVAGRIVIAAALLCAVSAARAGEPKALRFLDECGERVECVDMVLYLSSRPGPGVGSIVGRSSREEIETLDGETRTYPYVDFEIEVTARLAGGRMQRHVVVVEAYDDGIDCTGFGNFTAPVVGYSSQRNPILLTEAGELELVEGIIEVGCKTCIEFVERESKLTMSRHVSPAWDITFSNVEEDAFSYDNSGVYVTRRESCVQLHEDRKFEVVDTALCARVQRSHGENLGIPGMVRDSNSELLDNPNSRHWMVLYRGACT